MLVDWVALVATVVLGSVGLYLGNSYRRRSQVDLASARRDSYAELWEITGLAAPTRLRPGGHGVLTLEEREFLYRRMTAWYYRNGNGMLLSKDTRSLYLKVKYNLNCADCDLKPGGKGLLRSFPESMDNLDARGCLSIRQLSLLRTQMKSDLAVFGRIYSAGLRNHERRLLQDSLSPLWELKRPWRYSSYGQAKSEDCLG